MRTKEKISLGAMVAIVLIGLINRFLFSHPLLAILYLTIAIAFIINVAIEFWQKRKKIKELKI